MTQSKKANIIIVFIVLVAIIAFSWSYNISVTSAVANAAYNDQEILQNYNNEIIEKLVSKSDASEWQKIVDQYEDIVITIENSENEIIAKTVDRTSAALDVKVRTPFDYHGEAYLIGSSVYLLRDYMTDVRETVKFIFIEFLMGISFVVMIALAGYMVMIKPFKKLYIVIEEYEKNGTFEKVKLKGYAGTVYNRFFSMAQKVENQKQNQRRIIASISHDIKTPLTSIMGYAERLTKGGISEERKEKYIERVYEKSLDIEKLVEEFDEYLSSNSTNELKREKVLLSEISNYLSVELGESLAFEKVEFVLSNTCGADEELNIDIQKMKRVFSNIVSNSLKHFKGERKEIFAEIYSDKNMIYFAFSDNGKGVEEERMNLIFEPFYTSDEGRKVAGLGLSICKEIVEAHKGKIKAEKSASGGLKITVGLPKG